MTNIYVMKKNGELCYDNNIFNTQVSNYIKQQHNNLNEDIKKTIIIDNIKGIIFHKLMFRRCNCYFVLQKINNKSRFLCYLEKYINRNGSSCGTTIDDIKKDHILLFLNKAFENNKNKELLIEYFGKNNFDKNNLIINNFGV